MGPHNSRSSCRTEGRFCDPITGSLQLGSQDSGPCSAQTCPRHWDQTEEAGPEDALHAEGGEPGVVRALSGCAEEVGAVGGEPARPPLQGVPPLSASASQMSIKDAACLRAAP